MFTKPTTKNQIVHYLRHRPGWHRSAEIQAMGIHWHTTGATISRRLRELYDDGKIGRQIVKGNANYRYEP